jgi:hypothetical protein
VKAAPEPAASFIFRFAVVGDGLVRSSYLRFGRSRSKVRFDGRELLALQIEFTAEREDLPQPQLEFLHAGRNVNERRADLENFNAETVPPAARTMD